MKAILTGIGWMTADGMGRGKASAPFAPVGGQMPLFSGGEAPCVKSKRFGRLDSYSKVGLTAISMALTDAGLARWTTKRPIGIIAATESGCIQTDIDYFDTVSKSGGKLASPNLFAYTLPNAFIGEAGILFGLCGMGVTVNVPEAAGERILGMALDNLAWGDDEAMLAGICELPAPAPFGPSTGAIAFGAFVVLEKSGRKEMTPYGEVCGEKNIYSYNGKRINTLIDLIKAAIPSE